MDKIKALKKRVLDANILLPERNLVVLTWGNVSEIDRESGLVAIKPSGVSYRNLKEEDIVVLDLDGNVIEGTLNPSSDTPTHLELYRKFEDINAIVHTHSEWATIWAQSGRDIPAYGTTHADYFYGDIPCTRKMTEEEINSDYELNTGKVIVETFNEREIKPSYMPGVVVYSHGPFAWGKDAFNAVDNALVLECVSKMAYSSEVLKAGKDSLENMQNVLLDKHFLRKHGANYYYGQR